MKTRNTLRNAVLVSVTALVIALPVLGHAETTKTASPPYTRGQMCFSYGNLYLWYLGPWYSWWCYNAPQPHTPEYGDESQFVFNSLAETARGGELVVGGWERLGTVRRMANAYRAASMLDFNGPPTTGPISASAEITGLNVSSPYENGFRVCLKIIDLGPINGYAYPTVMAADCFSKSTPFRALSATASSVGANRKFRAEVSLDNTLELGGARATVSSISYTLP